MNISKEHNGKEELLIIDGLIFNFKVENVFIHIRSLCINEAGIKITYKYDEDFPFEIFWTVDYADERSQIIFTTTIDCLDNDSRFRTYNELTCPSEGVEVFGSVRKFMEETEDNITEALSRMFTLAEENIKNNNVSEEVKKEYNKLYNINRW